MSSDVETPPPRRYHLIAPRHDEGRLDLAAFLPGDGPLELDVGFGRGLSVFERAAVAPESRILGVEIKNKWSFLVEERRKRMGLEKVRVLAADIRELLPRCDPPGAFQRASVHFPDPWWKKRHRKRRVVDTPFLDALQRSLALGGELFVQTDVEDRALIYRDSIAAHPGFELQGDKGFIETNPFGAVSNREKRAAEDGLPVWRILAHRVV